MVERSLPVPVDGNPGPVPAHGALQPDLSPGAWPLQVSQGLRLQVPLSAKIYSAFRLITVLRIRIRNYTVVTDQDSAKSERADK